MGTWTERTELLLGADGVARLKEARVAVIGLGGVGAAAAEMLTRAGVGSLVLVDNDRVGLSNINRQLIAFHSTLDLPKTDALAARLRDINPDVRLTVISEYLSETNIPAVFAASAGVPASAGTAAACAGAPASPGQALPLRVPLPLEPRAASLPNPETPAEDGRRIDYVVDAIDTLSPKIALIQYCLSEGIPLVSSMGSGAKLDATRVRVADISKTRQCPLAHMLRKRLHKLGISSGFQAVYSEEEPRRKSVIIEESRNKKSQVGSISYLPAVFGCVCAQTVICAIADVDKII